MAGEAAAAYQRFLDALSQAGDIVTGPLGARNERERAEGFRHLTRVLSIATEMLVEKCDTARPEFTRWMNPHRKMLGDSPGTFYDAALVDPAVTYRIDGHRGTGAYLGVCLYGTGEAGARRIVGNLDDVDLDIASDGAFTVWLAPEGSPHVPAGASVLVLEPDATDVVVRQYFVDPAAEVPASYTITAVPGAGPPPPLTEAAIAARLEAAGSYVRDIVEAESTLSELIAQVTPTVLRAGSEYIDADGAPAPPPVDPAAVARVMPTPAIQYSGTWFDDLGDDEVLLVEGAVPACRFWSVQLLSRWMESGDYEHHPVVLSGREISAESDGTFRITVAHRDPGVANWLSTTGLRHASIAVRALLADGVLDVSFRRERLPPD
jgi:hypothetical protein